MKNRCSDKRHKIDWVPVKEIQMKVEWTALNEKRKNNSVPVSCLLEAWNEIKELQIGRMKFKELSAHGNERNDLDFYFMKMDQ